MKKWSKGKGFIKKTIVDFLDGSPRGCTPELVAKYLVANLSEEDKASVEIDVFTAIAASELKSASRKPCKVLFRGFTEQVEFGAEIDGVYVKSEYWDAPMVDAVAKNSARNRAAVEAADDKKQALYGDFSKDMRAKGIDRLGNLVEFLDDMEDAA
jgi:hypothetical protein